MTALMKLPDDSTDNPLRALGGSKSPALNSVLLRSVLGAVWQGDGGFSPEHQNRVESAAAAALEAFKPTDAVEGMLAAQAVAMHHGAMECFRRAMLLDQPSDIASKLRRDGANLARGMAEMAAELEHRRGKGTRVLRVEKVIVHEGGQAVVGIVQAGAGARTGELEGS